MKIKSIFYFTFLIAVLNFALLTFNLSKANAATISSAKDTITTSRPSASAPLASPQAASASQVTIVDNGSIFLASDSAVLRADTGETQNTVTVASMSAANTPSSNQRIVYFNSTAANLHHQGDPITTAISAMHTMQFTVPNAIPSSGKIVLTFPGSADTSASPSATTFAFNGLTSANAAANISYKLDGSATCTFTVSAPSITCAPSAAIAAATTITFLIGCADASTNETSCTLQSPRLINPTKTAAAGTADLWQLIIRTQDTNSVDIDTTRIKIATIDSVYVQANVDPILTFTIAGVNNATAANNGNTTGCGTTETTNSGINSSATVIDLGTLNNTPSAIDTKIGNIAAQTLTITTNGINGYVLTGTSSGQLINPATGFFIASNTTPASFPNGTPWFGIHACGLDVSGTTWSSGSDQSCNSYITGSTGDICDYGWPTQTSSVTLASDSTGPVANSLTTGNGITSVEYAAGIDASVPMGLYRTVITYVATPTF